MSTVTSTPPSDDEVRFHSDTPPLTAEEAPAPTTIETTSPPVPLVRMSQAKICRMRLPLPHCDPRHGSLSFRARTDTATPSHGRRPGCHRLRN